MSVPRRFCGASLRPWPASPQRLRLLLSSSLRQRVGLQMVLEPSVLVRNSPILAVGDHLAAQDAPRSMTFSLQASVSSHRMVCHSGRWRRLLHESLCKP